MPAVCLYLKAHQPYRLKPFRIFDIGHHSDYFDDASDADTNNVKIIHKIAEKSYRPTNALLLELLERYPEFRVSFSLTGVLIEQLMEHALDVIEQFKKLVATGRVELLGETYHHSLSFFYSQVDFEEQVQKHAQLMKDVFGVKPTVFVNTEMAYNNHLAQWADKAGYKGIITEGWDAVLGYKSSNFVYRPAGAENIKLLMKNYQLSDDVAFRFSEQSWPEWPMTSEKFAQWINALNGNAQTVNLFMDYETMGEHQWAETGIFDFMRALPGEILKNPDNSFKTPSEVIDAFEPMDEVSVEHILTWADTHRDLTAWNGNAMQQGAIQALYGLEERVRETGDSNMLDRWRRLQISDHLYYMCTKWSNDGDVHAYFSPYGSPYEAFITYMNVLKDFKMHVEKMLSEKRALEEVLNAAQEQDNMNTLKEESPFLDNLKKHLTLAQIRNDDDGDDPALVHVIDKLYKFTN